MWTALKTAFAPAEKRKAVRLDTSSGTGRIDSRSYPLVNWSATGVLIGGHDDHLGKGQRFRMQVDVKDGQETISFDCEAMVVRKLGDKLAAQFVMIDKHKKAQMRLLQNHRFHRRSPLAPLTGS
jgi:hypothetical protein